MSETAPGPEHKAKHELTQWLERHGATVWWEESNKWGHRQFHITRRSDAGGIPDLVVEVDGFTFVVEFKSGGSVGEVYDALLQLHGYWFEHISNEQRFKLGGRVVHPDGFLTATKNSRVGRLFPPYVDQEPDRLEDFDEGRAKCHEYGQLPPAEFRMTEQHIRTLWRLGKRSMEAFSEDPDAPHLGSLLSEHLEEEQIDPRPAVLWNRGRSNQDWMVIGE